VTNPCFCWNDEVYQPAEDSWLAWKALEELPYVGGVGVDVGCGSGILLNVLKEKVDRVIGVDINECAARACKKCGFEVLMCNSMSCLREARLVVSNLPYLPCSDDPITCDAYAIEVIKELRVRSGGFLVLIYSSLTSFNPLDLLEDYKLVNKIKKILGFEELIAVTLRKV